MSKYRIIERKYISGSTLYFCEKKILWFWKEMKKDNGFLAFFDTFEEAKNFLAKRARLISEETIVLNAEPLR